MDVLQYAPMIITQAKEKHLDEEMVEKEAPLSTTLVKSETLRCLQRLADRQVLIFNSQKLKKCKSSSESLQMARQIALGKMLTKSTDAFAIMNLGTIVDRFVDWKAKMPRVKPFYAVKCNNDPVLLTVLSQLGAGFDCASRAELEMVTEKNLAGADRIVYANTCKHPAYIEYAEEIGIKRMTFDCVEELFKMQKHHKSPELILRIDVTDPSAKRPLDVKFGCEFAREAPLLLRIAKQMKMQIIGISFHVGSGCQDPNIYNKAIGIAKQLFILGKAVGHMNMHVLDLGGGFPGCDNEQKFFAEISNVVCDSLEQFFPLPSQDDADDFDVIPNLEVIAEPGRYFASATLSVCANVIGATRVPASKLSNKPEDQKRDGYMYYLDDGVYGSFSCLSSHLYTTLPRGQTLFDDEEKSENETEEKVVRKPSFPSVVWGPTCDSRDQVESLTEIERWKVGDWIYYANMGAYTSATTTTFNGFKKPVCYYVVGDKVWSSINGRRSCA